MSRFLQTLSMKLQTFMYGRYGNDPLNRALLIAGLVLWVLGSFPYTAWLSLFALAAVVFANYRCFSRNHAKRQAELQRYYRFTQKCKTAVSLRKRMWRERHTHRYLKCKRCRAVLRVPKGGGKVEVGCPRCKHSAYYRT